MKQCLLALAVALALAAPAAAQAPATIILGATDKPAWKPSPDNTATFNGQALVTFYQGALFLKANVIFSGTPPVATGTTPNSTPAATLDFGKPAVNAAGDQVGPVMRSLPAVQANQEFVLFLRAVGPGGESAAISSPPFGYPAAPKPAASPVTFKP